VKIAFDWQEHTRLSASLFGAFRLFLFDGRQPTCIEESRKSLENCLL